MRRGAYRTDCPRLVSVSNGQHSPLSLRRRGGVLPVEVVREVFDAGIDCDCNDRVVGGTVGRDALGCGQVEAGAGAREEAFRNGDVTGHLSTVFLGNGHRVVVEMLLEVWRDKTGTSPSTLCEPDSPRASGADSWGFDQRHVHVRPGISKRTGGAHRAGSGADSHDEVRGAGTVSEDHLPETGVAVESALERGYYEIPSETTIRELAAELDVSRSTLQYRLSKAESWLISNLFETAVY